MSEFYTKPLEEQTHIKHIIKVLGDNNKMKRNDLFTSVQEKEEELYNKKPFYQTVNRDIQRLIDKKIISIVGGGARSQILTLNKKGRDLLYKIENQR